MDPFPIGLRLLSTDRKEISGAESLTIFVTRNNKKKLFIISLQLVIGLLFILGPNISNTQLRILYASYFADLILPFGFYFLLITTEAFHPVMNRWWVKALTVFALCVTSEFLQYFGIYALAVVFDPVDILMYAIGVFMAGLFDKLIFARLLPFWK